MGHDKIKFPWWDMTTTKKSKVGHDKKDLTLVGAAKKKKSSKNFLASPLIAKGASLRTLYLLHYKLTFDYFYYRITTYNVPIKC